MPKAVANMLIDRKKEIEELKEIFGEEYVDYDLVICSPNGRPMEGQIINRMFGELISKNGLPKVVFHSLRHTSTTYKLRLSGGDIKAVQGDTGHAQATMVTERYAHIMDDDRRLNTEKMQKDFYEVKLDNEPSKPASVASEEALNIANALVQSPELINMLKALLNK